MYFTDALGVLLRRWYVLLIGTALTAGALGAVYYLTPTHYQASGQLLLLLPAEATGSNSPTNPYLNLQPGLNVAGALIASTLSTPEAQRALAEAGFSSTYSISLDPGNSPLLAISTEDTDPAVAIKTRDEVMLRLNEELKRIQDEERVPRRQFIHTRTNSTVNIAEPLTGDTIRAVAAVGAMGGMLTLAAAFLIDRLRLKGRSRGTKNRPSDVAAPPPSNQPSGDDPDAAHSKSREGSEVARELTAEEDVADHDPVEESIKSHDLVKNR